MVDAIFEHSARVAALADPVARRLGWEGGPLQGLRLGSALHDVGKLSVSPEILRKPGPLDAVERAEIEQHPAAGARLLEELSSAQAALTYVLCHHERWDGWGYPRGLAGTAIPVEARLLAVADAYDAMTSDRPYRSALDPGVAFEEIERCAGTQFDPRIAYTFLAVWAEGAALAATA